MTQKPPQLQQVDAPGSASGVGMTNARTSSAQGNTSGAGASTADPSAPATPEIYEMLAELRRDIDARRMDQDSSPASDGELFSMMSDLRRDMSVLKRSPVAIRSTSNRPVGTGAIPHATAISPRPPTPPTNIVYVETARPSILRRMMSDDMRPALSLATALVIAVSGLYLVTNRGQLGASPAVRGTPISTSAIGTVPAAIASGTPVYDALAAGAVSPQGVNGKGVTATRALSRANAQLLVNGASRDTDEAAFWLKRYMSDTLGDVRMARALTQLGATYAEQQTGKGADYAKARQVWEMAGALGDPVAMCFLGRLFENGWSVAANTKTALQWYERARDAGGCPAVEESITRVQ